MALRNAVSLYPHRGLRLVTPPAVEPITADELRAQLKIDSTELGDTQAALLIASARGFLEEKTGLAFIEQTWQVVYDQWPGYNEPWWDGVRQTAITELWTGSARSLELPRYPLISLDSCKTYDTASNETSSVIATVFNVDTISRPGRIAPKDGQMWPAVSRSMNGVILEFTAGFGATAADVPAALRTAVLILTAYFHDHQGECDMREATAKSGALDMMASYAVARL